MSDSAPIVIAPQQLQRHDGHTIAYHKTPGAAPGIIFLGGFMSDMTGTKAMALEAFAQTRGQAFLRFDYLGHGQSSGRFADGTIGRWAEDAVAALDALTEGPQVLVGSSMGGWIMLLTALARPQRVAGLVGIAAAPDFTEDLMAPSFTEPQRQALERDGFFQEPSDYSDEPTIITKTLIEDGRQHLLLRDPIPLTCPVRLIQGLEDPDVPWRTALRIEEALASDDVEMELVEAGDHRLSKPHELALITATVGRLLDQLGQ